VRIAVVGGGLAGLVTAHRLTQPSITVSVLEASERPGGGIGSVRVGDLVLPAGPDAFWGRKPWATALCRELGLELVAPAASGAWLWTEGGLVAYPAGAAFGIPGDPGEVLRWPGLSRSGRRRALADLLKAKRKPEGDQTLGAMLRRRLGDEATDRAVGPLLEASTLGDVDRMSLRATYPELEAWEGWQGSLIRGAQAANRQLRKGPEPGPILVRPRGGLEALVGTLVERLGPSLRISAEVEGIAPDGDGWRAAVRDAEPVEADVLVLAVPADVASRLLGPVAPGASRGLADLQAVHAVTALLVYAEGTAERLPPGTGFVVPRGRAPMRSCAWLSSRWPDLTEGGRAVVSCALGGAGVEDLTDADDDAIVDACVRHLAAVLPLPAACDDARVVRWPGGIPCYGLGHLERVAAIREQLPPGIVVVGRAYDGTDVPDVVRGADEVAATITDQEPRT
jgi:oxygen-dependent protoporphyrinogen oxidase